MNRTFTTKITIGKDHDRKVMEDEITIRKVRTVYGRNFNILGCISKPWVRRNGWRAYDKDGQMLGTFTTRINAIDAVVESRL